MKNNIFQQSPVTLKLKLDTKYKYTNYLSSWIEGITNTVTSFENQNNQSVESQPEDDWSIFGFFNTDDDIEEIKNSLIIFCKATNIPLPTTSTELVEDKDWISEVQKACKPITAGCFYIYGSHIKTEIDKNKISILLDAGRAFGTGEHETTSGCLLLLSGLSGHYKNMLDMGCGSAVLSIAMAKRWRNPVLAVDIDEQSVFVARENIVKNNVESFISCEVSDGFDSEIVQSRNNYDLITANILANPLIDMASDMSKCTSPKGRVILSGFLLEQMPQVIQAYEKYGFKLADQVITNNWCATLLEKHSF